MRRTLAILLSATAFLAVACGDDEDDASAPGNGPTEAPGLEEGAPYDISAGEFIAELQPQKQEILEAFVADSEACGGAKVDGGFVLLVTDAALDADPGAPLAEVVEPEC